MPSQHGIDKKHAERKGLPEPPVSLSEAAELLRDLYPRLDAIKHVLEAKGLAPAHFDEWWGIPIEEGEIFQQTIALMCDVQSIENLLIDKGLADETEFVPLAPRWRIDGHKHHYRNWRLFEMHVRQIILAERAGVYESNSFPEFLDKTKE